MSTLQPVDGFIEGTWGSVFAGDVVIAADGKRYHVLAVDDGVVTLVLASGPSPGERIKGKPRLTDPVLIEDRVTPAAENAGVEVDAVALAALITAFPESFRYHFCPQCGAFVLPVLAQKHTAWHEELCS